MAIVDFFIETIDKLRSIKRKDRIVPNPQRSNNFSKTISNVNDVYKYINIWNNQIDEMVVADNYSFKTDESAIFIELRLGRCQPLLNKVSTYPEAVCVFHIFSGMLDGGKDTMERNIDIYKYRDICKSYLTGWSPSNCSNFMCFDDTLDYKHGNITKYLIGFNFHLTDFSGSIFDSNSPNYLSFKKLVDPTLSVNGGIGLVNRTITGWKVCKIKAIIVAGTPDINNVQKLGNEDTILVEYNLLTPSTFFIPYLIQYDGIEVLSRFLISNEYFEGDFFLHGKIDISQFGNFKIGNEIEFDASLPLFES